ncbi:MAG: pseudouridine synthase [Solirubrobacterales bacterium]
MRLAKYLARAGVASRRACERIIAEGRVTVDGRTATDPALAVDGDSLVEVDGRVVGPGPAERGVYALNTPAGVVSTAADTHGRPTVVGLVDAGGRRLYPVGRLDADSTGLILLTDDGELANLLTHPRYEVPKRYRVRVAGGTPGPQAIEALRTGIELEDGLTAPAGVEVAGDSVVEVTIREGRNRQVRRMCEAVGHPVRELCRVAFGPLELGSLAPGQSRRLDEDELERLRAAPGPGVA